MTRDKILIGLLTCLPCILTVNPAVVMARPYAGFSGLAAAADSALTAGTNPAGITRFEKPAYQVEALAFFNQSTWEGELGDSGQTSRSSESGETFVPSGYLIRPINDEFSFSFTLLGMGFSDDLGDWPGKYFITSYESVNVSAFPSIAYRINDKLSVAARITPI